MDSKQILFVPGLFALGILVGIAMMRSTDDSTPVENKRIEQTTQDEIIAPVAEVTSYDIRTLHARLDELSDRLERLESRSTEDSDAAELMQRQNPHQLPASMVDTPVTAMSRPLTSDALVRAGLDNATAEDIVRRRNQLELDKLELRDAAVRGGYLGTERYMDELQELIESGTSIRDELGDDRYDRYLFANGQTNRIRVASVMLGSAAEQSGIAEGDLILAYDDQRLFEYTELQNATSQGDRDEFVSVTIVRDDSEQTLWVPRGPLGIRLSMTRLDPDS